MARMHPEQINPDTPSSAEKYLFAEFQKQLPDDIHVFHSVAWQTRRTSGGMQDGEADFVILLPNDGLLIVEVKGGPVFLQDGEWYSGRNKIKNPFEQGTKAKYNLLAKFKEDSVLSRTFIPIERAAAFPDIDITSDLGLGLDEPRELVMDRADSRNLSQWLSVAIRILVRSVASPDPVFSQLDIDRIVEKLSPSWNFSVAMNFQNRAMNKLTEDQFKILDYLQRQRRVAIAGCAGSGKTWVAVEKAHRLHGEGFQTLFLCNNPFLADVIRQRLVETSVFVVDFMTWVKSLVGESGDLESWVHYNELSEGDLSKAFDKLIANETIKYDAIIVDEGQDFRDSWWVVAEAALNDSENGILYIFHDDNQALYPYGSQFKYPIKDAPFVLSKNCRNTGEIFQIIKQLHPQAPEQTIEFLDTGLVKNWQFPEGNQEEALDVIKKSIREATGMLSKPEDLVIITTEIGEPGQSILNGIVIDESLFRWQNAIKDLLKRWEGNYWIYHCLNHISSEPYPTDDDIQNLADTALNLWSEKGPRHMSNKLKELSFQFTDNRYLITGPPFVGHELYTMTKRFAADMRNVLFFTTSDWPKRMGLIKPIEICLPSKKRSNYSSIALYDVASYKGLEANGVILFHWGYYSLDSHPLLKTNLYVGVSRAKHLLYFVGPQSVESTITASSKE